LYYVAAKNNSLLGYYDEGNNPATPELVNHMPANAELIFWDYYHTTPDTYTQKIKQHREMGCQQPWIASKCLFFIKKKKNKKNIIIKKKKKKKKKKKLLLGLGVVSGLHCRFLLRLFAPAL
jgi:hypothetical protein